MAILLSTEQRSTKGRLIHAGIITLLLLGGVTMVYPFLVMLSGSVRSGIDEADLDLVPEYLVDDAALYRKFLEFKYNADVSALNQTHHTAHFSFETAEPPARRDVPDPWSWEDEVNERLELEPLTRIGLRPMHFAALGGVQGDRTVPANLRRLRDRLIDEFDGDLNEYVLFGGPPTPSWLTVVLSPPRFAERRYDLPDDPRLYEYTGLTEDRPDAERIPTSVSGHFLQTMVVPQYGRGDEANAVLGLQPGIAWSAFRIPDRVPPPEQPRLRALWLDYVQSEMNPSFLFLEGQATHPDDGDAVDFELEVQARWKSFLQARYVTIEQLRKSWGPTAGYRRFDDIGLGGVWVLRRGIEKQDYASFVFSRPEQSWRVFDPAWVAFGGPEAIAVREWNYVQNNATELRTQFATRNYINVWDELAGEGRALWNTLIYCTLSIVLALLINPLAAYGLSRFKLRGGYKALLILMATMAFPPMVTLIPQFIALRNLGLMNTFVALLLPLIANGYLIFLLKGFFDSLPRELYEAGTIDGASELRMFFQIAMALSKPILAVVALQTFTAAYTMFLYALLVAPDRDMWLISVWLFQYQERASSSGVFASVVIASVPTLLLFLLVQRTIMRGIVVPTEK